MGDGAEDKRLLPDSPDSGFLGQLVLQALAEIRGVAQSVGQLQAQNLLIMSRQDDASKRMDEASDSRRLIHTKIDDVNTSVSGVNARLGIVEDVMTRIEPLVDAHDATFHEKIGQKKLLTKGRVVFLAALGAGGGGAGWMGYWQKAVSLLSHGPWPR